MRTIWVDEWLEKWTGGDLVLRRTTREGTPGKCSTGGEYHFREDYHIFPKENLVVLVYSTTADFFYCPGCGSFVSPGEWKGHKEYCAMTVEPLGEWLRSRPGHTVRCSECGHNTTLEAVAASGWCCPQCKHSEFGVWG